jgi:alkaline phosphatase
MRRPIFLSFLNYFTWILVSFLASCHENSTYLFSENSTHISTKQTISEPKKAKNIIFLIGDGMALAQVSALNYQQNNHSIFDLFPIVGFHKSYSFNELVTDSAAGATAFSCGCKTYNNAIGVHSDTTKCQTILEKLKLLGFSVGMATSCSASHATPAAFIAHQKSRAFYYEIAEDYLKTDFDCLVAAGEHYFYDRDDKRNLVKELRKKNYTVISAPNLRRKDWSNFEQPIVHFTDDYEPTSALNGRHFLPESVDLTTNFLKNRSKIGFFLMIEGSQIDWAGHANDEKWMLSELRDFDKTVTNALNFAKKDGETLVIVTGDHDGGGASIEKGSNMGNVNLKWGSKDHGGVIVPVFAFGPGAEDFAGIYENTAIHEKMLRALSVK